MESVHTNEGIMLWYTAKDTKLKSEVPDTDKSDFCKPSKIVFTLAEKFLRQVYMIGLDNYCTITPQLSDLLNETEPHAIGTARSNKN